MKTVTVVLLAGLAVANPYTVRAETELKGSPVDLANYLASVPGQIRISASAEVRAEANRAVLQLQVNTRDKLLQRALEKNHKIRDDIVRVLTEQGLDKQGIRVSKFSSTPAYGFLSKKPAAYDINSEIVVHAANENQVQSVATVIDTMPEVLLEGLRFEHTDEDRMKWRAVGDALDKIVAQKKTYEEKLGVTLRARGLPYPLGGERSLGEHPALRATGSAGRGEGESISGILASDQFQVSLRALAQKQVDFDTSQFDQVVYRAQLTIVFDVLAK